MKSEVFNCDNCGKQFEPKNGVGELKISFTDPKNPIKERVTSNLNNIEMIRKPNVTTIRKNDLCPECAHMIMTIVRQSLQSENGKE